MMVYLLRHGYAAPPAPQEQPALTKAGRSEIKLMAESFKKKGQRFSHLWHSPKSRAAQTAEIFREVMADPSIQAEEKQGLIPEGNAGEIFGEIDAFRGDSLLVVSHLPFIADLAGLLAGDSSHPNLVFPPGGLFAFDRSNGGWKYLWYMDPSGLK